jgi:hypothetical protein
MKTVLKETIDGHEVVKNFGYLTIEPIETQKVVDPIIADSDEQKSIDAKKAEIGNRINQMLQSRKAAIAANRIISSKTSTAAEKEQALKDYDKHNSDFKVHDAMITELQKDIPALSKKLAERKKQEIAKNAVYFDPGKNEEIIDPAEMVDLINKSGEIPAGCILCRDGSYIEDNRGKVHWVKSSGKWAKTTIGKLGDKLPAGEIWETDLDDAQKQEIADQLESERLIALSPTEKTAEKDSIIEGLALQAVTMRSKLEIQGTSESAALTQSQDWYNAEVALIETKYA